MWKLQWSLWKGVGVHWPGCLKNFPLFPFILNILLADIRASAVFFWKSFDIFLKCKFRRQCAHLSGMQTNQCNHHHTFPVSSLWSKSFWKFISSLTYYLPPSGALHAIVCYYRPSNAWFWIFLLIDFEFSHWLIFTLIDFHIDSAAAAVGVLLLLLLLLLLVMTTMMMKERWSDRCSDCIWIKSFPDEPQSQGKHNISLHSWWWRQKNW